jgi:hypothetical protein
MTLRAEPSLTICGDLSWEVPVSVVESRPAIAEHAAYPAPDHEIEPIVRSLEARRSAPRALIEQVVAEELVRFRDARIRSFVPVLVERAAADRLAGLSVDDTDPMR